MNYHKENEWIVVDFPPTFTLSEAKALMELFKGKLFKAEKRFLLDATDLTYINSTGIGILMELLKSIRSTGGELCIRNLTGEAHNIFEKTGLTHLFVIKDSDKKNDSETLQYSLVPENVGSIALVKLSGMVYYPQDGERFYKDMNEVAGSNKKILLDLTDLKYIDHKSIGVLKDIGNSQGDSGKEIRFFNTNALMKDIFVQTGFTQAFKEYSDFESAVADWKN